MSNRAYYMMAAKKDGDPSEEQDAPQVNRFSDIQKVDQRRHEVLDYLMIGYRADEIAGYMGEELETIKNDIKEIMAAGYQARDEELVNVRDEIMRTYRVARKEGFKAFKLSQGKVKKTTIEKGTNAKDGAPYSKDKETITDQAGDPRFLTVMIDSAREMGKVTGAQKHREAQIQNNIQNNQIRVLSPNRTKMPSDFDRWTKKPEGADVPSAEGVKSEDL